MSGRVLVVDDDRAIRGLVVQVLGDEGLDPTPFENGAEALDYLVSGAEADLVLLDMRMPVMDGWEFASQLQQRKIEVPIVVLTAATNPEAWAQQVGARGYVSKPFDIDELVAVVQGALGCRHA